MLHPIRNWLSRHRDPTNFWLHMVGIPAMLLAVPMLILEYWLIALGVFVAGYALQFIGHAVEGNPSGEELLVRRIAARLRRRRKVER